MEENGRFAGFKSIDSWSLPASLLSVLWDKKNKKAEFLPENQANSATKLAAA